MSTELPSKGERTRQALLAAAVARFGRDGYRSTSVATIARDAHLSSTAAYPYFASKEALFIAAVDHDTAGVIDDGLMDLLAIEGEIDWLPNLLPSLMAALDRHPLARRVLAGLEPDFTVRLMRIPSLASLRQVVADRIVGQQATGVVRPDIDPDAIAEGSHHIVLSLLMSLVQTRSSAEDLAARASPCSTPRWRPSPRPRRRARGADPVASSGWSTPPPRPDRSHWWAAASSCPRWSTSTAPCCRGAPPAPPTCPPPPVRRATPRYGAGSTSARATTRAWASPRCPCPCCSAPTPRTPTGGALWPTWASCTCRAATPATWPTPCAARACGRPSKRPGAAGAALAGCSAGAMALTASTPDVRSGRMAPKAGLALLAHLAVLPHFDRMHQWDPTATDRTVDAHPGLAVSASTRTPRWWAAPTRGP